MEDVPVFLLGKGRKLQAAQVRHVRTELANGASVKALAIEHGVNGATISRIKNKQSYKGVI